VTAYTNLAYAERSGKLKREHLRILYETNPDEWTRICDLGNQNRRQEAVGRLVVFLKEFIPIYRREPYLAEIERAIGGNRRDIKERLNDLRIQCLLRRLLTICESGYFKDKNKLEKELRTQELRTLEQSRTRKDLRFLETRSTENVLTDCQVVIRDKVKARSRLSRICRQESDEEWFGSRKRKPWSIVATN
jgi:hypothetical protein